MNPPRYRIEFTPAAQRAVRKLDRQAAHLVLAAISLLAEDPHPAASKRLVADAPEYRLRVRDYRVIYTIEHGMLLVTVVRVAHRREVYER